MNSEITSQIRRLEDDRMKALMGADSGALAELLGDDLVHIHANGHLENKQQYLDSVSTKLEFIRVERPSLEVRAYGDVAIATGVLDQTVRVKASGATINMRAMTTQSWVRRNDKWLQVGFQATRLD
jgi:ketosteroid isomerase-like protein